METKWLLQKRQLYQSKKLEAAGFVWQTTKVPVYGERWQVSRNSWRKQNE